MLLLLNSQLISQTTNTKPTNCLSDAQMSEIFKGLKQGEYLKVRLDKTETTLTKANDMLVNQEKTISDLNKVVTLKNELYNSLKFQHTQDLIIKDSKIQQLQETMDENTKQAKKIARRKSTKNFLVGAGVGGAIATGVILFLITK